MTILNRLAGMPAEMNTLSQTVMLQVLGMRCAGCVQSVERQLLAQNGVTEATVNLVTQKARVTFLPSIVSSDQLAKHLTEAGFATQVVDDQLPTIMPAEFKLADVSQLLLAIALVVFSAAGHVQEIIPLQLPVVGTMFFHAVLATLALIGPGRTIVIEGTKGLLRNQPTMDTLVSMGSVISYGVSILALAFPRLGWDCFFDATVMIIGLILVGRTLEGQAKSQARSSFHSLLSLQSQVAYLLSERSKNPTALDEQQYEPVEISTVLPGDRLRVFAGDHFPVDGVVLRGETHVDESMLTGESRPIQKKIGDFVTAGTLNQREPVTIEASRTGTETTLAKITRLVEEAQARKAPIQSLADLIAGYFTYGVMAIALLTFLFWWAWGTRQWPEVMDLSTAMHDMAMNEMTGYRPVLVSVKFAIAVLVIACPCALGLATPTALLVGTSMGAERGLLLRGGDVLERCSQLKHIVFDKTGTLTTGQLSMSDCWLAHQPHTQIPSPEVLLQWIASVEQHSRHPLAIAILNQVQVDDLFPVESVEIVSGAGIAATYRNQRIYVGSFDWLISHDIQISPEEYQDAEHLMKQGKSVIFCAVDQQFAGAIALQDSLRADAKETLLALEEMGLETHILTGDRPENTQVLLEELELSPEQIEANLSPGQKAERLGEIQQNGPVAMVGDGINDAPALAQADIGIALSSGTDAAIETAEIVLTRSQVNGNQIVLGDIVRALRLSRLTFRKIKQNLFWAFAYNLIGIPMAAGLLFPKFHLVLSPAAAAALMAFSSVSVITNSILLQRQSF